MGSLQSFLGRCSASGVICFQARLSKVRIKTGIVHSVALGYRWWDYDDGGVVTGFDEDAQAPVLEGLLQLGPAGLVQSVRRFTKNDCS